MQEAQATLLCCSDVMLCLHRCVLGGARMAVAVAPMPLDHRMIGLTFVESDKECGWAAAVPGHEGAVGRIAVAAGEDECVGLRNVRVGSCACQSHERGWEGGVDSLAEMFWSEVVRGGSCFTPPAQSVCGTHTNKCGMIRNDVRARAPFTLADRQSLGGTVGRSLTSASYS